MAPRLSLFSISPAQGRLGCKISIWGFFHIMCLFPILSVSTCKWILHYNDLKLLFLGYRPTEPLNQWLRAHRVSDWFLWCSTPVIDGPCIQKVLTAHIRKYVLYRKQGAKSSEDRLDYWFRYFSIAQCICVFSYGNRACFQVITAKQFGCEGNIGFYSGVFLPPHQSALGNCLNCTLKLSNPCCQAHCDGPLVPSGSDVLNQKNFLQLYLIKFFFFKYGFNTIANMFRSYIIKQFCNNAINETALAYRETNWIIWFDIIWFMMNYINFYKIIFPL